MSTATRFALGLIFWTTQPLMAGSDPAARSAQWRAQIDPEDLPRVELAIERARAVLEALPESEYGVKERPQIRALLDAPTLDRPDDRLLGNWRCRSIQIQSLGLFSYPYFRCRILRDGDLLAFNKLSGSQRRSGELFPDGPGRWVFLGGSHVNDDEPRGYSRRSDAGVDGSIDSRASDSVGLLETLADGRLRIVFDANASSVELYELVQ